MDQCFVALIVHRCQPLKNIIKAELSSTMLLNDADNVEQ